MMSQSSTRVRDDISCVSQISRRQLASQRSTPVSQKSVKDDLTVKNSVSDMSPQVPPRPAKPSFFLPQGQNNPNLLLKFLQNNQEFSQLSREWTEEPVEDSTTTKHINQSMSLLAAPTPAPTQIFRTEFQDRFVLSSLQSPENNVGVREQENTFNQFASIQQPSIPLHQATVLFPVESFDNQLELFHSSIGEVNQFSSSKLITLPDMPMNQPASATVTPKKIFCSVKKRKRRSKHTSCIRFTKLISSYCSVNKTNTYQTSSPCNLNEITLQRQFHSEKGANRVTNEPRQIHFVTKIVVTIPCTLVTTKIQLLKPFETLNLQLFK